METERFPVFLKSQNQKSYYRISSKEILEEIQIIGSKFIIHKVQARTLPERNLIFDLLENEGARWIAIQEEEYSKCRQNCLDHLEQIKDLD